MASDVVHQPEQKKKTEKKKIHRTTEASRAMLFAFD
jgi:hypothetical protein